MFSSSVAVRQLVLPHFINYNPYPHRALCMCPMKQSSLLRNRVNHLTSISWRANLCVDKHSTPFYCVRFLFAAAVVDAYNAWSSIAFSMARIILLLLFIFLQEPPSIEAVLHWMERKKFNFIWRHLRFAYIYFDFANGRKQSASTNAMAEMMMDDVVQCSLYIVSSERWWIQGAQSTVKSTSFLVIHIRCRCCCHLSFIPRLNWIWHFIRNRSKFVLCKSCFVFYWFWYGATVTIMWVHRKRSWYCSCDALTCTREECML